MKELILKSIEPIIDSLEHVEIDESRLLEFCRRQSPGDIKLPDWREDFIYPWDNEEAVDFFLLFNCINFAFWKIGDKKKWGIDYRGKRLDGAYGLMGALTRAVEDGVPLLDGAFLKDMTTDILAQILRGEGELVLFQERVDILREIGRGLTEHYDGSFKNLFEEADGSASGLVGLLVRNFPSFNDRCKVDGMEVKFYKRAQLAPAMIYGRFCGKGPGTFTDIGDLTVFADYKLPQALRGLGILRYREGLARKVDSLVLIPPCSREEVEIRCTTIWACELILKEYQKGGHRLNSAQVDAFLWLLAHEKSFDDKPYHLTETIYY